MSDRPTRQLRWGDQETLLRKVEIPFPEEEQLLPPSLEEEEPKPSPVEAARKAREEAISLLGRIKSLSEAIDSRCQRFSVTGSGGKGSPLFQAMVRVFNERTTTVTYSHYVRALELRAKLAAEDARELEKS